MIQKNKLIVVGVLALLAYYLYTNYKNKKIVQILKDGAENLPSEEVVDGKINECEKEWIKKIGSLSKFRSLEAREQSKNDYIASCLKFHNNK